MPTVITSTRSILISLALGAVATLCLALGTPPAGAIAAEDLNSPEVRISHSIETGHLLEDMQSGKISEDDIVHAASTGFDVNGQHVGKWIDLSAAERADLESKTRDLQATMSADPELMASAQSIKGSETSLDMTTGASPAPGSDMSFGMTTGASPTPGSDIQESKHWWNHLIHWFTLHLNNATLRAIIAGAAGYAGFALCSTLDLSRVTCALTATFLAGSSEFFRSSNLCNGRGISIPIPDTVHSHCQ